MALDDAFGSLAEFPERCPIAPKVHVFLLKSVSSFTDGNLIFTAYSSPSNWTPCIFCISATADENVSHQANDMKGAEFGLSQISRPEPT